MSDDELIERARAGNGPAFEAFYSRRQSSIYGFAFHMTGSTSLADDVTQETFLALIRSWSRYDVSRGGVMPFVFGIARNILRVQNREMPLAEVDEAAGVAGEASVELELQRVETIQHVRDAILSLPAAYREAVVLCELEEVDYAAAAAALEIPIGTLRSRLHRGRALLAQKLKSKSLRCGV